MNSILLIAGNEFSRVVRHPLIIILAILLCLVAIINATGASAWLPILENDENLQSDIFLAAIGNLCYFSSLFFWFFALCLGVISISSDRSNGSIRVLLTKPLYRRDIIAGKFLGISVLILVLLIIYLLLCISSIMIVYRAPLEGLDVILKISSFGLALFLGCTLSLGVAMLFGILLKDLLSASIASVSFLCLGWLAYIPKFFGDLNLIISPKLLFLTILNGWYTSNGIFNVFVHTDYFDWLNVVYPLILLMLFETSIIFLINCILFNNEES